MAEKKTTKKNEFEKLSLEEARQELQKLVLAVKTNQENNYSKVKKLKKHIARLLTEKNKK